MQAQARVRAEWTMPQATCDKCGGKGKPVLLVAGADEAGPVLACDCGDLAETAKGQIEWPFETGASAKDFERLGFEVEWV